jgi:hypothetical protein
MRMNAVLGLASLAFSLSLSLTSLAEERPPFAGANDKFTPVVMQASVKPIPFLGSDGLTHLDYELQLINPRNKDVTIDSIEVLDAKTGAVLLKLGGPEMTRWLWLMDREPGGKLGRSQAAYVWLDVKVKGAAPRRLRHRVTFVGDAKDVPVSEGGEVAVSTQPALVISPPLEGKSWVAVDACCTNMTHRRSGMPINGAFVVAQRFAIDWIKLGDDGRIVHGNWMVNTDYPTYGQRAIAVADATVVSVLDGLPERKAGALPPDTTLQNATGNHVILDLGGGRYGFYAHLQPGTIRVKAGNRVKRGQVLALLGNSGNTTGPHLHFHVMDGMSPLSSQGVPYVLTGFNVVGQADEIPEGEDEKYFAAPVKINPLPPPAARRLEYPMNYVVVDFPDGKRE